VLCSGWLRRNGVPYSDRTTLTEFFDQFAAPDGDLHSLIIQELEKLPKD